MMARSILRAMRRLRPRSIVSARRASRARRPPALAGLPFAGLSLAGIGLAGVLASVSATDEAARCRAATVARFATGGSIPLLFDGFTVDNVGQLLLAQPKKEQPPTDPANPQQPPKVAYDQLLLQKTDKGWMLAPAQGQELAGAPVNKERVESDVLLHLRSIRSRARSRGGEDWGECEFVAT